MAAMSASSSGSFSLITTAAVVCLEKRPTQPSVIPARSTTSATRSVTSMKSRGATLRPAGSHFVEAVAAVDRPPHRGQERHPGRLSAFGTNHIVHFPHPATPPRVATDGTAIRTARGLVLEPLGRIKLLLPSGEHEVQFAVAAG